MDVPSDRWTDGQTCRDVCDFIENYNSWIFKDFHVFSYTFIDFQQLDAQTD